MKDYIAVDWGSTQLRGWLIRNGQCVETKQLPLGITRLNGRSPADVFAEHLAPGAAPALPVLMAGMIGSDAGWQAVPYLACPAAIDAPGQQRCAVAEGVWIIPGLKIEQDGEFNVMRGEETQLLGPGAGAGGVLRAAGHPLQMGTGDGRHGASFCHGDDRRTASSADDAIADRQRAAGPAAGRGGV
jgi:2-keto-3-deoxy-galactonokinase